MNYTLRGNYIARIWRQATETTMDIADPRDHSWNDDLSLQWPEMVMPDDLIKHIEAEAHIGAEEVAEEYDTYSEDEVSDASGDKIDNGEDESPV